MPDQPAGAVVTDDPPHGTLRRYRGNTTRPGCWCDLCREAAREYRYRYPLSRKPKEKS